MKRIAEKNCKKEVQKIFAKIELENKTKIFTNKKRRKNLHFLFLFFLSKKSENRKHEKNRRK